MKQAARFAVILLMLAAFLAHAAALWAFVRGPIERRRRLNTWIARYARAILRLLRIRVTVSAPSARARDERCAEPSSSPREGAGRLIVANHLSYLDALAIASVRPACFVTSMEVRRSAGIGWLCRVGGCLFVDRRSFAGIAGEVRQVAAALRSGIDVIVFPEATSTDGARVLPFRAGLFKAATIAAASVQPLCVNYASIDGEALTAENRDRLFWYGDMTLMPHLWGLAGLQDAQLRLLELPEISASGRSAADVAMAAHAAVSAHFEPIADRVSPDIAFVRRILGFGARVTA